MRCADRSFGVLFNSNVEREKYHNEHNKRGTVVSVPHFISLALKARLGYLQQRSGSEPNLPLKLTSFRVIDVQKVSVYGALGVALSVKVAATPPAAGGVTDPTTIAMSQDAPALSVPVGLGLNSFELLLIAAAAKVVGYWLLLL
jgi:hypothetical protein